MPFSRNSLAISDHYHVEVLTDTFSFRTFATGVIPSPIGASSEANPSPPGPRLERGALSSWRDAVQRFRTGTSTEAADPKPQISDFQKEFPGVEPEAVPRVQNLEATLKSMGVAPGSPQAKRIEAFLAKAKDFDPAIFLGPLMVAAKRIGIEKLLQVLGKLEELMGPGADKSSIPRNQRELLIYEVLNDIARPTAIDQGKDECAAASLQVRLAGQDPVQYATMMTRLAIDGVYTTKNGLHLRRPKEWQKMGGENRRISEQLFQETIYAQRGWNCKGDDCKRKEGMSYTDLNLIEEELLGKDGTFNKLEVDDYFRKIEDDLARGRPVSVGVGKRVGNKIEDGHAVSIIGIDKRSNPPRYLVVSWGREGWMTQDQLKKLIMDVTHVRDPDGDDRRAPNGKVTRVF